MIKEHLEKMGIQVQGPRIEIDAETEAKLLELKKCYEDSNSEDESDVLQQMDTNISQLSDFSFSGLQDGSDMEDEDDGDNLLTASELFKKSKRSSLAKNPASVRQGNIVKPRQSSLDVNVLGAVSLDDTGECQMDEEAVENIQNVAEIKTNDNFEKKDMPNYELEKTSFDTSQFGLVATPDIKKVNLDVSTLIVLVSNVCNGRCQFVFKDDILSFQAECERKDPVLPKLQEFMKDKELYACRTAVESFHKILHIVGGAEERERGNELLKTISVVDDCISEKTHALKCSAQIKKRARIIFGTGDGLQAITMSANMGFVRAAENQGFHYAVFLHESRALTEQKEATASAFTG